MHASDVGKNGGRYVGREEARVGLRERSRIVVAIFAQGVARCVLEDTHRLKYKIFPDMRRNRMLEGRNWFHK